jgi:Tol biopolymer transport system component
MGQNPKLVSVNSAGTDTGNDLSGSPSISADGRLVVFESQASNLVSNDTNGIKHDVFVRDLQAGTTSLVSINSAGTASGNGDSGSPVISADGRFVAFVSIASDLVTNDLNGVVRDVFVRDLQAGTTSLVSINRAGTGSGNKQSFAPSLSFDGQVVAFMSYASNLVANDTNGAVRDVFVRDLQADTTSLISIKSAGTGSGNGTSGSDESSPVISPDGQKVLFESQASDLVSQGDTNGFSDVFLRNRTTNATLLVSVNRFNTRTGNGRSYEPVMSDLGRFIAFTSDATDLVTNDHNGASGHDVYVRDTVAGTTRLVSVALTGAASLSGPSNEPTISADGHRIAFTSMALDLVPQANSNTYPKIYVRDIAANKTTFVNGEAATNYAPSHSENPTISRDGRFVVFVNDGGLAGNNANSQKDVFVRDLQAAATVLVSVSNDDGLSGNSASFSPAISADASVIAFVSYSSDIVSQDTNFDTDVFAVSTSAGAPQFSILNNQVDESAGAASLTVKRTFGTEGSISVHYETFDDSALAGQDYTATNGTLVFADGETIKTITIPISGNTLDEDHKTLYVLLADPTNGGLLGGRCFVRLTILDDDPTPSLSIGDPQLIEGNSATANALFKVTLSAASARLVSVNYRTADGTAKTPGDYQSVSGTLNFEPGQTSQNIVVPVVGDMVHEPDETFVLSLSSLANATFAGGKTRGTATINNDDPLPALYSLELSPASVAGGNVFYATINLTAPAPSTGAVIALSDNLPATTLPANVNIPAGARSKTFTFATQGVTASQSGLVKASYAGVTKQAALTVRLVGVRSVTISPELVVGGYQATGVIILERPAPPGGLLVNLQSALGAATVPASVQIPAGSINKKFDVTTKAVTTDQRGTITATANDISRRAILTIKAQANSCASTSFGPAIQTLAGNIHSAFAADEFNGDGKQDLVVVNYNRDEASTISILLGNGAGGFGTPVNHNVGVTPVDVTTADFNRDGKRDVAVVNAGSDNVSILLGNGTGGFKPATHYPVEETPGRIRAADFNLDGKTDLVVFNGYTRSLSVLLGNGAGGFYVTINHPLSEDSDILVVGDFNLDGKPDVVAGYGSILLGNGAGRFEKAGQLEGIYFFNSMAAGDFNNDGQTDLVVAYSNTYWIMLGDGRGNFSAPRYVNGQGFMTDVAVADFNWDGRLDLASSDIHDNKVVLHRGNGDGSFAGLVSYPAGTDWERLVVKDFNGDGKPDIAATYLSHISVKLNTCR